MTVSARRWYSDSPHSFPVTGDIVRKTDAVMARTAVGLCLGDRCPRLADDEDGKCSDCRRKEREA